MLALPPALLADMISDKAGEAFAAHPFAMGSPSCIGMFVGALGFGDPSVLSLLAVEVQSDCAECYLTIAQARAHGFPIEWQRLCSVLVRSRNKISGTLLFVLRRVVLRRTSHLEVLLLSPCRRR